MDVTLAAPAGVRARPGATTATALRLAERAAAPLFLLVLALCVYRPWIAAPFSILDFGEFIPLMRGNGPVDGYAELVRYFAGHGRSTWVTYGWIQLNWLLVGDWAHGWDLLRFALLVGVTWLGYAFMRRLGCSRLGAAIGASLLVVSTPAQGAWTRMTGEPIGLAALLGASMLALEYRTAARWLPRAAAIALLLAVAVLCKEVLAVLTPLVVVLAGCWQRGRGLQRPRLDRRTLGLAALSAAAVAGTAVIVLVTLAGAESAGYANSYGSGTITDLRVEMHWKLMALPLSRTYREPGRLATGLLAAVVALGWALLIHRQRSRDGRLVGMLLLMLVPLLGVAVFLPWPIMEPFYAYPFSAATAVLLGLAATALLRRVHPAWVAAPVALALAVAALDTVARADQARDIRLVNGELARELAKVPAGDTVLVAATTLHRTAWSGPAHTLQRYLGAILLMPKEAQPMLVDVRCSTVAPQMARAPESLRVVTYNQPCMPLPHGTRVIQRRYSYLNLLSFETIESPFSTSLWRVP